MLNAHKFCLTNFSDILDLIAVEPLSFVPLETQF